MAASDKILADVVGVGRATNEPPENEPETWNWLESLAEESERIRKEESEIDRFDRNLDIYYGKHWPEMLPSYKPPIVVNELRTLVLQEANDLSEPQLRVYIMKDPRHGGRDLEAERAFRAVWQREQVDLKVIYASVWAMVEGTGFLRAQWDADAARGMGDVVVNDLDPRVVLPDPDALDDRTWSYVIVDTIMDLEEVRRIFPVSGQRVTPDDTYSSGKQPKGIKTSSRYTGPMSNYGMLVGGTEYGYKKARVRVLDCLIQDSTVEKDFVVLRDKNGAPLEDENGAPQMFEQNVAKYPHGRRIVGANGVILLDGPVSYPPVDRGDFGIVRVVLEPTLGRFWGHGMIQQTAELQLAADKMESAVVENAIRLNNGMVRAIGNTGLDMDSFASIPGQLVQINTGSQLDIIYPPPMPSDMIHASDRMLDKQRRVLGFSDRRVGESGRGNVSSDLAETEISQAQGNTRLRSRMLYFTIQRLSQMIFSRMIHGYTTDRIIPAVEGEAFAPVQWRPVENPQDYSLYVDPASFQVMSRTMLRRLGLALYRAGAIDRKSLLEHQGWPDWEDTAKRMDEREQNMIQAKMNPRRR